MPAGPLGQLSLTSFPPVLHDFTQGPIARHIGRMAIPIFAGMLFQTLYYLVDLYFVAKLGGDAVAGVSAAGNLTSQSPFTRALVA